MSRLIEKHIPCPMCSSSDAYCIYAGGKGYCYSCKRSRKELKYRDTDATIANV